MDEDRAINSTVSQEELDAALQDLVDAGQSPNTGIFSKNKGRSTEHG